MKQTVKKQRDAFIYVMFIFFMSINITCTRQEPQPETPSSPSSSGEFTFDSETNFSPKFTAEGGSKILYFKATGSWQTDVTYSDLQGWVNVSPVCGKSGEAVVTYTVEPNPDTTPRTATLHFTCGKHKKSIEITQQAKEETEEPEEPEEPEKEVLELLTKRIDASASGGVFNIQLNHNQEFDFYPLAAYDWISASASRAVTTQEISFRISLNDTYEPRQAAYIFHSKISKLSDTLTITQDCQYLLSVSPLQISLPEEAHDFTIEIVSNMPYTYTISTNWIIPSGQSKSPAGRTLSHKVLTFHGTANNSTAQRKGQIIFQSTNGTQTQIVEVTQDEKDVSLGGDIEDFEENETEW